MAGSNVKCLECELVFPAPAGAAVVNCPICNVAVAVPRKPATAPRPIADVEPRQSMFAVLVTAVLLLIAAGGMFFAWEKRSHRAAPAGAEKALAQDDRAEQPTTSVAEKNHQVLPPIELPPQPPPDPPKPRPDRPKAPPDRPRRPPDPPKPPPDPPKPPSDRPEGPALTEDQKKVNAAIDRGVVYVKARLKKCNDGVLTQNVPGMSEDSARDYTNMIGQAAFMAFTLLECGVKADDPEILRAAQAVRAGADSLTTTYMLSVGIMFLDRLGDTGNRDLIKMFAMRLAAGQLPGGTWDYASQKLSDAEQTQLLDFFGKVKFGVAGQSGFAAVLESNRISAAKLPPRLRSLPVVLLTCGVGVPLAPNGNNSTTQFGLLGMWVAQRSGLPVQPSLVMVANHFRNSQLPDGSWGYAYGDNSVSFSMTCSGLLGVAVGRVLDVQTAPGTETPKKIVDPAVMRGLKYLGNTIAIGPQDGSVGTLIHTKSFGDLYYLWSLARVGAIYNLDKIGGKDWYAWASKLLVDSQKDGGQWEELFVGPVDTCFALLILRRVNIAPDLTKHLEKILEIKVEDTRGK